MKKAILFTNLLALLVPGSAFASAATDAALGLGAFAVFNQIISGTGIFGAVVPAPRPVVLPAPPPPVAPVVVPVPVIASAPVIVHEYRPVYVRPPVYYAPVHRVYHAPVRTIVTEKRIVDPPGHAHKGHPRRGHNW
jgi:hypothetical protein